MPGVLPQGIEWGGSFPVSPDAVSDKTWHAYVHIPFCDVRCGYCDYNTYTSTEVQGVARTEFHQPLISEIEQSRSVLEQAKIDTKPFSTVFFGGGTPSLFSLDQIEALLSSLKNHYGIKPGADMTLELNPDSVDLEYMQGLFELGINRVSIGAQSFDPEVLRVLDRTHDTENVSKAVSQAKQAGLMVSIDLIYGAPGETLQSWQQTVEKTLSLEPDHLSAYALIVERGTKLERQVSKGILEMPDEDLMAAKYELLDAKTKQAGLDWYELSNFSRSEQAISWHNRAYWSSNYWWGFGPGAHSFMGDTRWWNKKHPAAYSKSSEGDLPIHGYEKITERQHLEERLLLEIRMRGGLQKSLLDALDVKPELVQQQLDFGYLEELNGSYSLTLKGRQMADRVVLNLLN